MSGGEMMDTTINVLKQNIKVAQKAVDDKDFAQVNIIGNRVMSDLLVGARRELMIIGWMLKDLSGELSIIKELNDDAEPPEVLKLSKEHLGELKDLIEKKTASPENLWDRYLVFEKNIRKYLLPQSEADLYKVEPEFSKKAAIMMIEHLESNRELLLDEKNQLIFGIANDLSRIVNEHGGEEAAIVYLVFRALGHHYRYLMYEAMDKNGIQNKDSLMSKIGKYIDDINLMASMIRDEPQDKDKLYQHSNKILGDLGLEFRKYVLNYVDIPKVVVEGKLELPEKAKETIGNLISKSFEEKLD